MQRPLKITARDFNLNPAIEAEITRKVEDLDNYYERISGCEVTVGAPVRHHRKGGPFEVRVRLTVPNRELVANRQFEEGLAAAVREAFDAIRRQLEDYVREQRGAVKAHEEMARARVSELSPEEGYGFLATDDGREIYFHRNSVLHDGFARMAIGTEVRFVEEEGEKGPQATTVVMLREHPKR
jgi:cold shock CspA family protein